MIKALVVELSVEEDDEDARKLKYFCFALFFFTEGAPRCGKGKFFPDEMNS